jgi:hypothetical protein
MQQGLGKVRQGNGRNDNGWQADLGKLRSQSNISPGPEPRDKSEKFRHSAASPIDSDVGQGWEQKLSGSFFARPRCGRSVSDWIAAYTLRMVASGQECPPLYPAIHFTNL